MTLAKPAGLAIELVLVLLFVFFFSCCFVLNYIRDVCFLNRNLKWKMSGSQLHFVSSIEKDKASRNL